MIKSNRSIKSSVRKTYFNCICNGDIEKVKSLVSEYPLLLQSVNNKSYNKHLYNGMYYAMKNLQKDIVCYLQSNGLSVSFNDIEKFIMYTWKGSPKSYIFIKEILPMLPSIANFYKIDSFEWLLKLYKKSCYYNLKFENLEEILNLENINNQEIWTEILYEFKLDKINSNGPTVTKILRDLHIKYLLNE